MKKLLLSAILLTATASAFAQTKTVTNADLEKYKQQRLAAEREYRENYERLGFPSPAELAKRNEQSQREMAEQSARLQRERLAEESLRAAQNQTTYAPNAPNYYPRNTRTYFYGYAQPFGYYNYNYNRARPNRFNDSESIRRLRETDFINRRNGYNSPFRPQIRQRPNFSVRGGRKNF